MNITQEQLNFLEVQKISLDKIFDATGLSKTEYHQIMKEADKIIAIGVTPCAKFSHSMRTRNGHCVQCNTASIAFLERHYDKGYIYIAGSKKEEVVKVGFASDINNREQSLNDEGYGEINDWKIIFQVMCKNAGKIEFNTHKKLNKYLTNRNYLKNNKRNECYEIFSCSYSLAKKTLDKNIGDTKNIKKSFENLPIVDDYEFDNIIGGLKRVIPTKKTFERAKPIIRKSNIVKKETYNKTKVKIETNKTSESLKQKTKKNEKPLSIWMVPLFFIVFFALIKTCAMN
jgi:hypothetical protein